MDIHRFMALPHRFRWSGVGGENCMTFPARWALESIGVDPAEELRGTYHTREEALAIVASYGGALEFMSTHLSKIGAKRVQQAETGDIGLIKTTIGESYDDQAPALIGAVRFGPLWACIHPGGVRATVAESLAVWRLPC